jgi:riboflavin kinase/FMN adenylyltransferase
MRIFKDLREIGHDKKTIITLGTFDGLHLGHQRIVQSVLEKSGRLGCRSFLITFDPHPRKVVPGRNNVSLLSTIDEKIAVLEKLGLDNLFIINFTKEFSQQSPEEFVKKYIVEGIGINEMVIGYDHHFGKGRGGDINVLQELGSKFNFEVSVIPEYSIAGEIVSSTKIRDALLEGDVVKAGKMLGRYYSFKGKIIRGDGRGKKLGFPTANISVENEDKLMPAIGIYAGECIVDSEKYYGLLSMGRRPTFHSDGIVIPEFYIFDFDKDIYDKVMQVKLIEKIRDEEKFNSVEELISRMKKDEEKGKEILIRLRQLTDNG